MTVDTRAGSVQINIDKYNEKYDNLAQSKLGNKDTAAQKQKPVSYTHLTLPTT